MGDAAMVFGNGGAVKLIDVRTPEEYASGHIPGSVNVPLDRLDGIAGYAGKDDKVFIYCRSGARSRAACEELAAAGYTDLTEIGGILDWQGELEMGAGKK